jgi:hypothetical protein
MHWTRSGAQAMLDVRSVYVNGDWEAYQGYRQYRLTRPKSQPSDTLCLSRTQVSGRL